MDNRKIGRTVIAFCSLFQYFYKKEKFKERKRRNRGHLTEKTVRCPFCIF